MTQGLHAVIYPVSDLAQAKVLFTAALGAEPEIDETYYVGYKVGGLDVGLDPHGHAQGLTSPVAYWKVDDIAAAVDQMVAAGAQLKHPPRDVGGGMQVATVVDIDGNVVGLAQS